MNIPGSKEGRGLAGFTPLACGQAGVEQTGLPAPAVSVLFAPSHGQARPWASMEKMRQGTGNNGQVARKERAQCRLSAVPGKEDSGGKEKLG